jgi:hypothetical protein
LNQTALNQAALNQAAVKASWITSVSGQGERICKSILGASFVYHDKS